MSPFTLQVAKCDLSTVLPNAASRSVMSSGLYFPDFRDNVRYTAIIRSSSGASGTMVYPIRVSCEDDGSGKGGRRGRGRLRTWPYLTTLLIIKKKIFLQPAYFHRPLVFPLEKLIKPFIRLL